MIIDPKDCLENVILPRDYYAIINGIHNFDVSVKVSGKEAHVKILEYVKGVPSAGPQRADKEFAIEYLIVKYGGKILYTNNRSRIGDLVSAAIDDSELIEEVKQKARKDGFEILRQQP